MNSQYCSDVVLEEAKRTVIAIAIKSGVDEILWTIVNFIIPRTL
jgi:hypothetical protein